MKQEAALLGVLIVGTMVALPVASQTSSSRPGSVATEADRVLESTSKSPTKRRSERPRMEMSRPAGEGTAESASGARVAVQRFVFSGPRAVPVATLEALVMPLTGRDLSFTELHGAADAVSNYYRSIGLLATAFLPPQTIRDGVVRIEVRESVLSGVQIERAPDLRLRQSVAETVLRRYLRDGAPVSLFEVEAALHALNTLRGVRASAQVHGDASSTSGQTSLHVRLEEGRLWSGQVGASNFGSRATGRGLANARVDLNDALGLGDHVSLGLLSSGRALNFARLDVQVPVHASGTTLSAAMSSMRLRAENAPASPSSGGTSNALALDMTQPLTRRRDGGWVLSLRGETRHLVDQPNNGAPSDRDLLVAWLALKGERMRDDGGFTALGAELRGGRVTLNTDADRASDAAGAKLAGAFRKLSLSASHVQAWPSRWSVDVALRGQFALNRSLEFSEKMAVGGADALRGYPAGEALSDSAVIGSAELRRAFTIADANWQVSAFADAVRLQRWRTPIALGRNADGPIPNRYGLTSAGLGLRVGAWGGGPSARVAAARPLGQNPGRDLEGRDSDGRAGSWRYWLQIAWVL